MAKGLQKSIKVYLSKLRKPESENQSHLNPATGRFLSACKYPRTTSFSVAGDQFDRAAKLSDADCFLFESHNYDGTNDSAFDFSSESPRFYDPPSNLRASQRFFVSPGTTNSLVEEARLSVASTSSAHVGASQRFFADPDITNYSLVEEARLSAVPAIPDHSVAVTTFSKDPYDDFRLSMKEMVHARRVDLRQPLDWDFMEELLCCYLELNEEDVRQYILEAFADLVVSCRRKFYRSASDSWRQESVV